MIFVLNDAVRLITRTVVLFLVAVKQTISYPLRRDQLVFRKVCEDLYHQFPNVRYKK